MTHPIGFKVWVLIPGNQIGAPSIINQWPYLWQHLFLVLFYLSVRINFNNQSVLFRVIKNNALVIRQILVKKNKKLDADENLVMKGVNRTRVEDAAKLEGITFEQAMERRKGYRYLY